jgi:hypothetical protein
MLSRKRPSVMASCRWWWSSADCMAGALRWFVPELCCLRQGASTRMSYAPRPIGSPGISIERMSSGKPGGRRSSNVGRWWSELLAASCFGQFSSALAARPGLQPHVPGGHLIVGFALPPYRLTASPPHRPARLIP